MSSSQELALLEKILEQITVTNQILSDALLGAETGIYQILASTIDMEAHAFNAKIVE